MESMQRILGEKGPKSIDETPTVALAISGGGYRAVSTSCGAMEALMEKDLFDALMYCVGLSGSVWYLSATYSRRSFESLRQLKEDHDWLRGQLGKKLNFNPWTVLQEVFTKSKGKMNSLTDAYGIALRDVLLTDEYKNNKLSSLKEYVQDGKVPLPIFSAAHVKNNYPVIDFWEEIELTPFEATFASYRILVPIENLNSVWENGELIEKHNEPMLHYIMGFCGSAFAILLYHLKDEHEMKERTFRNSWKGMLAGGWNFMKDMIWGYSPQVRSLEMRVPDISEEEFKREIYEPRNL